MKLRMNQRMEGRWQDTRLEDALLSVTLQPRLSALIHAPFVRHGGCLIFGQFTNINITPARNFNRTEYEVAVNDVDVAGYLDGPASFVVLLQQATKAAMELAGRLEKEGTYRVVLSLHYSEGIGANLRFYERRHGEQWISDDIDEYELNDLLVIDT